MTAFALFRDPSSLVLLCALAFDLALGELPARIHPVVWMGKLTTLLERLAPGQGRVRQLLAGLAIALFVPAVFALPVAWVAGRSSWLSGALTALVVSSTFAVRELGRAGMRVHAALDAGDLSQGRAGLRSLCSRDPTQLDSDQVVAATVESLSENTSDSLVAPLFYYVLFGAGGAVFYRAVNTLDAMIGYHGRYEYLGRVSARLDDILNFIPARLTAWLLIAVGALSGQRATRGIAILSRDGANTESPNAGRPMAAMAGLLGLRLEKAGHYTLGDPERPLDAERIREAWNIVRWTCYLAALLALALLEVRSALRP